MTNLIRGLKKALERLLMWACFALSRVRRRVVVTWTAQVHGSRNSPC